eukprot:1154358-Pelagomonas_calceolata.AAC.8
MKFWADSGPCSLTVQGCGEPPNQLRMNPSFHYSITTASDGVQRKRSQKSQWLMRYRNSAISQEAPESKTFGRQGFCKFNLHWYNMGPIKEAVGGG